MSKLLTSDAQGAEKYLDSFLEKNNVAFVKSESSFVSDPYYNGDGTSEYKIRYLISLLFGEEVLNLSIVLHTSDNVDKFYYTNRLLENDSFQNYSFRNFLVANFFTPDVNIKMVFKQLSSLLSYEYVRRKNMGEPISGFGFKKRTRQAYIARNPDKKYCHEYNKKFTFLTNNKTPLYVYSNEYTAFSIFDLEQQIFQHPDRNQDLNLNKDLKEYINLRMKYNDIA